MFRTAPINSALPALVNWTAKRVLPEPFAPSMTIGAVPTIGEVRPGIEMSIIFALQFVSNVEIAWGDCKYKWRNGVGVPVGAHNPNQEFASKLVSELVDQPITTDQ